MMMVREWFSHNLSVAESLSFFGVFIGGILIFFIFKFFISRHIVKKIMGCESCHSDDINQKTRVYNKIALIAGLVTTLVLAKYLPYVPPAVFGIIEPLVSSLLIATVGWFILNTLDTFYINYTLRVKKTNLSIKGYVQLAKILVFTGTVILIIATLADKSPFIILSSLGAAAAIILFLFQHTLISLVANLQVSSSNAIRLGDWVEIPHLNIDGIVTDLALHTTTIQNWDNTVSRVPTKSFITEHFTNWQPMFTSGGRRIKRSLFIDQKSVHFITDEMILSLEKLSQLTHVSFLAFDKKQQLISNLSLFREFIVQYLKNRPDIRQDMLVMVRQGSPGSEGLPIEIYCFTSKVSWIEHERIQSEIFEFLIPITQFFSLRIYQKLSTEDLVNVLTTPREIIDVNRMNHENELQ